jgi:simple sugar transport system ATP-binding protein
MQARNRGTAVLLVSEDLDEILELADRILVIFDGAIVYETTAQSADRQTIGRHMAGHGQHDAPQKETLGALAPALVQGGKEGAVLGEVP